VFDYAAMQTQGIVSALSRGVATSHTLEASVQAEKNYLITFFKRPLLADFCLFPSSALGRLATVHWIEFTLVLP